MILPPVVPVLRLLRLLLEVLLELLLQLLRLLPLCPKGRAGFALSSVRERPLGRSERAGEGFGVAWMPWGSEVVAPAPPD